MPAQSTPDRQYPHMRIARFCKTFDVGQSHVYNLLASGKLRKLKLGGVTLIDGESIRELLHEDQNAA